MLHFLPRRFAQKYINLYIVIIDIPLYFATENPNDSQNPGPGNWRDANESMSDTSEDYQAQIAGENHRGQVYDVDGVAFDGYDENGQTLLDAKGRYSQFIGSNGNFHDWWNGADSLIQQARRQLAVAGNYAIEWHVMESDAATAIRSLFRDNRITGISVIHTPQQ